METNKRATALKITNLRDFIEKWRKSLRAKHRQEEHVHDAFLDSLDPYEIAILVFTTPAAVIDVVAVSSVSSVQRPLTGKSSYLWAGAIADVFVHRPETTSQDILSAFHFAVTESGPRIREFTLDRYLSTPITVVQLEFNLVNAFLKVFGRADAIGEIFERTEQAAKHLEWRGLIEDPFLKKVSGILISAIMLLPFNFTQQKGETHIESITWEYTQRADANARPVRHIKFKVREAAEIVIDDFVPTFVKATRKMTSLDEKLLTTVDVQQMLKSAGYYTGPVDGKFGPGTKEAIMKFQKANNLPSTGYITPETTALLKGN
jgi:Putative peptidoglycan binding domain